MGLGGTAKKIQKVADAAEKLYAKMNEIIGELKDLQSEVEETSQQVDRVEREMAEQRALVEALADQQGIDVDDVLASADLPPEPDTDAGDEDGDGANTGDDQATESENDSETTTADATTSE